MLLPWIMCKKNHPFTISKNTLISKINTQQPVPTIISTLNIPAIFSAIMKQALEFNLKILKKMPSDFEITEMSRYT